MTESLDILLQLNHVEVEAMPSWMKDQEPPPGMSYEDWMDRKGKAITALHQAAQSSAESFLAQIGYADSRPHPAGAVAHLMTQYAQIRAERERASAAVAELRKVQEVWGGIGSMHQWCEERIAFAAKTAMARARLLILEKALEVALRFCGANPSAPDDKQALIAWYHESIGLLGSDMPADALETLETAAKAEALKKALHYATEMSYGYQANLTYLRAEIREQEALIDPSKCSSCQTLKRRANSDGTTPGIRYTECALHRTPGYPQNSGV
jgi:hypothetical protein